MTAILVVLTILVAVGVDAILMAVRRHRVPVRAGVALQPFAGFLFVVYRGMAVARWMVWT